MIAFVRDCITKPPGYVVVSHPRFVLCYSINYFQFFLQEEFKKIFTFEYIINFCSENHVQSKLSNL